MYSDGIEKGTVAAVERPYSYRWKAVVSPDSEKYYSPSFIAPENTELEWRLSYKKIGLLYNIGLSFEYGSNNWSITPKILIIIENSKVVDRKTETFTNGVKKTIYQNNNIPCYFENLELNLLCELLFDNIDNIKIIKELTYFRNKKYYDEFNSFIDNEHLSDVTLAVGNKKFRAHKIMLAASSKVFAAEFQHDMKERTSNNVEIKDIDEEVVLEMIRFIYTKKVSNLKINAANLLYAADRYDLNELKEMCESELVNNLTVDTAVDTLLIANQHSATKLKMKCVEFINSKQVKDIMATDSWGKIPMDLIQELYKNGMDKLYPVP